MKEKMKESWDAQHVPKAFTDQLEILSTSAERLKSNAIFSNMKRWMYLETAIGLAACYYIFTTATESQHPALIILIVAILLALNLIFYFRFIQKAEMALAKDTKSALESIIKLLKNFIRRLKIGTLIFMPLLMGLVLFGNITLKDGMSYSDLPPALFLIVIVVSLVMTAIVILFTKATLPLSYQKWLKEYEALYESLTK